MTYINYEILQQVFYIVTHLGKQPVLVEIEEVAPTSGGKIIIDLTEADCIDPGYAYLIIDALLERDGVASIDWDHSFTFAYKDSSAIILKGDPRIKLPVQASLTLFIEEEGSYDGYGVDDDYPAFY